MIKILIWLKLVALSVAVAIVSMPTFVAASPAKMLSDIAQPVFETSMAKVVSPRRVDLAAEMDGVLLRIETQEATNVGKGDLLFVFDCRSNELALKSAKLMLKISQKTAAQARAELNRSQKVLRSSAITVAQHETVKLAFETASLDVNDKSLTRDAAALAVERCLVKAPFTGVVTKIVAGPGSYLTAGTLVMSMTETENLEVVAQLTPDEIDILDNSSTLNFVSNDEIFPLVIRAVEPVFDSATRAQRVLLRLPNEADLPIGLTGMLRWQGDRFSLPSDYLVRREAEVGLLIEQNGAETFHPVPGAIEGLPVLVRLPADTKVIRP